MSKEKLETIGGFILITLIFVFAFGLSYWIDLFIKQYIGKWGEYLFGAINLLSFIWLVKQLLNAPRKIN